MRTFIIAALMLAGALGCEDRPEAGQGRALDPDRGVVDPGPVDRGPQDQARPDHALLDDGPPDRGPPDSQPPPADARPPMPDVGPPAPRDPSHPLPLPPAEGPAPTWQVSVSERFPHDSRAFTQGLAMVDGVLYESTGLNGQSSVRIVDLATGAVQQRHDLAARYFGEGLAPVGDQLIQLTWRAGAAFIYDRATLAPQGERAYQGEGWGLTYDGRRLILSDGSDRLRFFDPADFSELGAVTVHDGERTINRLNELEYIDGEILANVWMTDLIVRIDPRDGRVIGWLDLAGIHPADASGRDDVLNGIAWDAPNQRLLVTGKRWPLLFSIRALPP